MKYNFFSCKISDVIDTSIRIMLAGNVIVETVMKENTGNENDTQSAAPTKVHGNATNDVSIHFIQKLNVK